MSADIAAEVCQSLIAELDELRTAVQHSAEGLTDREFWAKPVEPGNAFGHLVLHLTGNLNHFVGAQLGGSGYVRDREREFTESLPPPKLETLAALDDAVATFQRVVKNLTADQLLAQHPHAKFGSVLNTLVHLVAHFALHRGQISYIVRLVKPPIV
jgi:uncharacterized damage-inducible protein DinB